MLAIETGILASGNLHTDCAATSRALGNLHNDSMPAASLVRECLFRQYGRKGIGAITPGIV